MISHIAAGQYFRKFYLDGTGLSLVNSLFFMSYSPAVITSAMFRDAWEHSSTALSVIARQRGNVAIASCVPWTSVDLMAHMGQVYAMVNDIIVQEATEPLRPGPNAVAPTEDFAVLMNWFDERRRDLSYTLSVTDPDLPVWTWGSPSTANFYFRRMAHETHVHLFDLQPDLDVANLKLDRAILCDGIDEYFDVILPRSIQRLGRTLPDGSLHLHCTDGEGEWLVTVDSGVVVKTHEHAKAAVAWRGSPADLLLCCWGRPRPAIEVLGDAEVSHQWAAIAP